MPMAARAARAVAVVSLLAIAAVALPGRRGLEWDRLTQVPSISWAQVVLGAVAATVVLVALWRLVKLWRKVRPKRPEGPPAADGPPTPWIAWVVAILVTVGAMAGCYLVIRLILSRVPESGAGDQGAEDEPAQAGPVDGLLPVLFGMLAVLAVAVALAVLLHRVAAVEPEDEAAAEGEDAAALADAVVAAGQAMDRYDDTREAIIGAYQEMARSLGRAAGRRPSDTPMELLERSVSAGLVSRGAALELTEMFREARFSRHALPAEARGAAEAALDRVAAELAMAGV